MLEELQRAIEELLGARICNVSYYNGPSDSFDMYPGVCDVCNYGLNFALSNGKRYRVLRLPWISLNEYSIFVDEGDVQEFFSTDIFSHLREVDVTSEARWAPFINTAITAVRLFGDDGEINASGVEAGNIPYDLEIVFENQESLCIFSGNYNPQYGLERNDGYLFSITFDRNGAKDLRDHRL